MSEELKKEAKEEQNEKSSVQKTSLNATTALGENEKVISSEVEESETSKSKDVNEEIENKLRTSQTEKPTTNKGSVVFAELKNKLLIFAAENSELPSAAKRRQGIFINRRSFPTQSSKPNSTETNDHVSEDKKPAIQVADIILQSNPISRTSVTLTDDAERKELEKIRKRWENAEAGAEMLNMDSPIPLDNSAKNSRGSEFLKPNESADLLDPFKIQYDSAKLRQNTRVADARQKQKDSTQKFSRSSVSSTSSDLLDPTNLPFEYLKKKYPYLDKPAGAERVGMTGRRNQAFGMPGKPLAPNRGLLSFSTHSDILKKSPHSSPSSQRKINVKGVGQIQEEAYARFAKLMEVKRSRGGLSGLGQKFFHHHSTSGKYKVLQETMKIPPHPESQYLSPKESLSPRHTSSSSMSSPPAENAFSGLSQFSVKSDLSKLFRSSTGISSSATIASDEQSGQLNFFSHLADYMSDESFIDDEELITLFRTVKRTATVETPEPIMQGIKKEVFAILKVRINFFFCKILRFLLCQKCVHFVNH